MKTEDCIKQIENIINGNCDNCKIDTNIKYALENVILLNKSLSDEIMEKDIEISYLKTLNDNYTLNSRKYKELYKKYKSILTEIKYKVFSRDKTSIEIFWNLFYYLKEKEENNEL